MFCFVCGCVLCSVCTHTCHTEDVSILISSVCDCVCVCVSPCVCVCVCLIARCECVFVS